jgi:hypothetical protein
MIVTDPDARLEEVDRSLLARAAVERIQRALRDYRHAREPRVLLRGAQQALAATLALGAILFGTRWAFRRLETRFSRRYEEKIGSVQFQSLEILQGQRIRAAVRAVVGSVRVATAVLLVYLWLQFVLSSFPVTRPQAARLLSLVLEPLRNLVGDLVAQLPSLAFLLVLFFATRWLLRIARLFFEALGKGQITVSGFETEWALPTYRIARAAFIAFALVMAYPYIPGCCTRTSSTCSTSTACRS